MNKNLTTDQILNNPDIPVKPDMNSHQKVAVIVKDNGKILVLHDKPFRELLGWVEYDADTNELFLMTRNGNIHRSGLEIQESAIDKVKSSDQAAIIWVKDNEIKDMYILPVTIRETNLIGKTV